jgi:hypothetical protein
VKAIQGSFDGHSALKMSSTLRSPTHIYPYTSRREVNPALQLTRKSPCASAFSASSSPPHLPVGFTQASVRFRLRALAGVPSCPVRCGEAQPSRALGDAISCRDAAPLCLAVSLGSLSQPLRRFIPRRTSAVRITILLLCEEMRK